MYFCIPITFINPIKVYFSIYICIALIQTARHKLKKFLILFKKDESAHRYAVRGDKKEKER